MHQDPSGSPDDASFLALRDPELVARLLPILRLAVKGWFRSKVRGIEKIPDGGVLLVSNHSGGLIAMDAPVIAVAFFDHFGPDRPLYVLAHDLLFMGYGARLFPRAGFVRADRSNATAILRGGGATIVFPGGDHDVFRPSSQRNKIDFAGRTGYVRTALDADVPIVPIVSIGGQEDQLHLSRGEFLARFLGLEKRLHTRYVPVTFGFPFGLTLAFPPNLPLPTKIETRVLDPINVKAEFGEHPKVGDVDRAIRSRMQATLDDLARSRRLPVVG